MEKIFKRLHEVNDDPYKYLSEWKERNKQPIIGIFPMHIPEEIIHASGMMPVILWRSNEPVTIGHAHISPANCGLARSVIDDLVKGKLSFMDGMVTDPLCLQLRGMTYIIDMNSKFSFYKNLNLPVNIKSDLSKDYLQQELESLISAAGKFSGHRITDESLKNSIHIYNKHRGLLRQIYQLRRDKPGIIGIKDIIAVVQSGMLMDKQEHITLMEELVSLLERKKSPNEDKPKVVLTGGLCFKPQGDVLEIIESSGAVIVDDDLYTGYRYVGVDAGLQEKPLQALMGRYLDNSIIDPTKVDWEVDWADYVIEMVNKNNAKGVVSVLMKYCPPHMTYYPDIKRKLIKNGIPEVMLEIEHEVLSFEQVRTRVESFVNIIRGG